MKILYIHQYFRTPQEGGGIRSYHLAKGLVDAGHNVTMISGHNNKSGHEIIDGINVHYLKIPYGNHFGFIRRIWAFLRYVILSKKLINRLPRHDLAYVMTTPLTTGFIGLHIKKKFNIPFYFEVGDLWPEVPIKIGAIKNGVIKRLLYQFERHCYFEAQRVIALSPAIRNYIEATSPETKVHVLPNISDNEFFEPVFKVQRFSKSNPIKIGYFGTFGKANELKYLIDAAKASKNLPLEITLMGDGAQFSRISSLAKALPNITVKPYGNTQEVKKYLEAQDAIFVSFLNLEILNTGSPNKFFDGLAAGKLICINFGGWIRSVIEENDCGFYYDPLAPHEFVRKISVFIKEPEILLKYQRQSRKLAEVYYDKNLQVKKLLKIIRNEKRLNLDDSEVYILTA